MSAIAPGPGPGRLVRIGLAVRHPRWALAVSADRRNAGQAGSDLLAVFGLVAVAAHLRALVGAAWLAAAVAPALGVRALGRVVSASLVVPLGVVAVGGAALWALGGRRRQLARAVDLASTAALPLLLVELAATVVVRAVGAEAPALASVALAAVAFAWAGALLALAWRPARLGATVPAVPPAEVAAGGRRAGLAVVAVAAVGAALQGAWIAGHLDLLRPMRPGDAAPAFALPRIGPGGARGAPVRLADSAGKVTVVEFWATWCGPCLASLPRLDALARQHADRLAVIAVNLDDAARARALFDREGYGLTLVADEGGAADRYGVATIPHAVVISADGRVRGVARGGELDAMVAEAIAGGAK